MCWETLGIAAELELWVQGITGIDFLGCPEQLSGGTPAHGVTFLRRAAFALRVRCGCLGFNAWVSTWSLRAASEGPVKYHRAKVNLSAAGSGLAVHASPALPRHQD